MAIYHLSMGHVSRSTGRSSVQAVAYITRSCLVEERRGITADYRFKDDDIFWETIAPEGSGIDKKDLSIWNKLESFEDSFADKKFTDLAARDKYKNNARISHTYVFALPKELDQEQNIELVIDIIKERFTDKGLVSTFAIHFEEGNPHAHIMVSNRAVEGNIDKGGTFSKFKVARELFTRQALIDTRKIFADKTNIFFESLGIEERIDHRSYAERGIDLIPTQHKGWMAHTLERDGLQSRISKDNARILEENKERVAEYPIIILSELSSNQATFSELDVVRIAQKRMKDDPSFLTQYVVESALKEALEVGTGISNQKRYTTQEYFDREARVLESLEGMRAEKAYIQIDPAKIEQEVAKLMEKSLETGFKPNEGQINGIKTLCEDSKLSILIGRAGTGKTTTLQSVVRLHTDAGYKVIGMAPSATAAAQLEADTGCKSDTVAHYAYYWKKYDDALEQLHSATTDNEMRIAESAIKRYSKHVPDSRTVIVIDEVGMIGVGDSKGNIPGGWDAITKTIGSCGAKLILIGDDHQLKPVEAGDVFRKLVHQLKDTNSLCEFTEIMRQNIDWMREASMHLAELNTATALGMYENQGHIQEYKSNLDVYEAIAQQYLRNITREPDSRGIVIAATNGECQALNREIRSILKEIGLLPKLDVLQRGKDGYCVGDRIVFTKNDRGFNTKFETDKPGFFVQNSMQAIIQDIKPISLADKETGEITNTYGIVAYVPDHKATIRFNLENYKAFAHAYAVTGYKSQGATVDWVLAKVSKVMDAHALYVALTRHREDVSIYYSNEDFKDYNALVSSLSKANIKDLVVDYSISDENKEFWLNVQDYKVMGRELAYISALARGIDKENKEELASVWENYRDVEAEHKSLAKFILTDWEDHRDFVRQAGLTRESLEIAAGIRKRTLSRIELQAQLTVEQYVSTALEARQLWRDIRRTHPGIRAKSHPEWQRFEQVRDQRGVLANQIYLKPTLHRPFLKEAADSLAKNEAGIGYVAKDHKVSYSMATIRTQAEAHQSKMLQRELMRDNTKSAQHDMLKVLTSYTENRDMAGIIWQELRPKLKAVEGTLLKESFSKGISEYTEIRMRRDAAALQIVTKEEAFATLAEKVGIRLDFDRLKEQAVQAERDNILLAYQSSTEQTARIKAAHELDAMIKSEADLEKKPTISFIYSQGLTPKDIAKDALEYRRTKLFENLQTEPERQLFLLLDEYSDKCQKANDLYVKCATDVKDKPDLKPWNSAHYPEYKAACDARNEVAREVFDQRDQASVLAMAENMGVPFKDVELQEIFTRCEQANRTRHITNYSKANTPESKGEAAVAIRQMIAFERREGQGVSVTARQAYHAGIDFKELQTNAFNYGRACVLKGLDSEKEIQIYHALEAYENACRPANRAYRDCIKESKAKFIKPWETEKFKEYISLVTVQDEKAHQLIKKYDMPSVSIIAKEMGISVKKLDVEAHRHTLRQTLQTFMDGDRTNVPMAAKELLQWLDFDRDNQYKHTFKVIREQDLWPKGIEESLNAFFLKKRELRQENKLESKPITRSHDDNKIQAYKTVTYERSLSFTEIDQQLKSRMPELATHLIGNPTSRTSTQLRFGRKGSICVFMGGPKQGLYANHESGVYGGPLKLIEEQAGLTSAKEAREWAIDWLGGKTLVVEQRTVEQAKEIKHPTWTPIIPIQKEVENPDISGNRYLNFMLRDGAKETARYAYRDEQGNLKGYVFRIEKADGSKLTPPLAYCQNEKGFNAWKWQAFEKENKTPYGTEKLAQDSSKPILIVEGEKTCDAAQKLLPEYHVLTWSGGAGNVSKTNWQCLAGKDVVIWPDNDEGGIKAADTLQKIVTSLNTEQGLEGTVGIVALPNTLPQKWDLADKLPEDWNLDTVKEMITQELSQKHSGEKEHHYNSTDAAISERLTRNYTFEEEQILAYLRQEAKPQLHSWLSEEDANQLLSNAITNPKDVLAQWQYITDDYSFNPYKFNSAIKDSASYNDDRLAALHYLKEEIREEKHAWLSKEECQSLCIEAENDPLKTLNKWRYITSDYSFIPGGIESLNADQLKAYQALEATKYEMSAEARNELYSIFKDMPQDVLTKCQPILEKKQDRLNHSKLEDTCRRYIHLCDKYQSLSWNDPQRESIERRINNLSSKYLSDERFVKMVNDSRNEAAINRMNYELQSRQKNISKGISLDR